MSSAFEFVIVFWWRNVNYWVESVSLFSFSSCAFLWISTRKAHSDVLSLRWFNSGVQKRIATFDEYNVCSSEMISRIICISLRRLKKSSWTLKNCKKMHSFWSRSSCASLQFANHSFFSCLSCPHTSFTKAWPSFDQTGVKWKSGQCKMPADFCLL